MSDQALFSFDAPLITDPLPQLPKLAPRTGSEQIVERLRAALAEIPDDVDLDAPLLAIGLAKESLTGWHRARSMDALIGGLIPEFQAYRTETGLRYRRLAPMEQCPGYEGEECRAMTRGGKRCSKHGEFEREDLWNQA